MHHEICKLVSDDASPITRQKRTITYMIQSFMVDARVKEFHRVSCVIDRGNECTVKNEFLVFIVNDHFAVVSSYVTGTTLHSLQSLVPRRILIPLSDAPSPPRRGSAARLAPSTSIPSIGILEPGFSPLLPSSPLLPLPSFPDYSRRSRILASLIVYGRHATIVNRRIS